MTESATQQNHGATRQFLEEAGFEGIVSQPLSQFTVMLHTRTLSKQKQVEFQEWASNQDYITQLDSDHDGHIYRWNI